jgi:hypothetical protein
MINVRKRIFRSLRAFSSSTFDIQTFKGIKSERVPYINMHCTDHHVDVSKVMNFVGLDMILLHGNIIPPPCTTVSCHHISHSLHLFVKNNINTPWKFVVTKEELVSHSVAPRDVCILKDGDFILSRSLPYILHINKPMSENPRNRGEPSLDFVQPHVRQAVALQVHTSKPTSFLSMVSANTSDDLQRKIQASVRNSVLATCQVFAPMDDEETLWKTRGLIEFTVKDNALHILCISMRRFESYISIYTGFASNFGYGLSALNTLLQFVEHNPALYPSSNTWTLTDVSRVNGLTTQGLLYQKVGFGETSFRPRMLFPTSYTPPMLSTSYTPPPTVFELSG